VTKLKITIPIPKRHHFKENHSSSSSHQTRKKNGRPSIAITPAITTVGRLIIWRRPHGILWLYEKPEKGGCKTEKNHLQQPLHQKQSIPVEKKKAKEKQEPEE
jgi:hypothetical protein